MAINEYQLSTWSQQGSTTASANTYNSIKTCIEGNNWNNDVSFNIYLQGSYKNSTNIRGDSDVDVVIEFSSIFHSNKQKLSSDQLAAFNEYYSDGKYSLASFRNAVIDRLKNYYGEQYIEVGNKSIKVLANSGRLDCDVICCAEYREYNSFSKLAPNDYVKGIIFWTNNTNQEIINFPQLHYDNGVTKNQICSSNFKSSVRVIKNMRTRLV
ncbi:MAG: nucleotidyltransferase, partial [Marinilabiliaceae bacterium]|nr:nucleotidyltransferase [Marinilabiliaceae bacterium]